MKKIIKGKTYNTDTAIELRSLNTIYGLEKIYIRKKGELFYTKETNGKTWLEAVTLAQVREWCVTRFGYYFYGGDEEEDGIIDGLNYGLINSVFEDIKREYNKRNK